MAKNTSSRNKKNSIFSNDKPFYSKYYSRKGKALERRKKAIKQYDKGEPNDGLDAHDKYKAIMDNVVKADRDEVRGMDYDDVFDAADALVDEARDMWTAEELEEYVMNVGDENSNGNKKPF